MTITATLCDNAGFFGDDRPLDSAAIVSYGPFIQACKAFPEARSMCHVCLFEAKRPILLAKRPTFLAKHTILGPSGRLPHRGDPGDHRGGQPHDLVRQEHCRGETIRSPAISTSGKHILFARIAQHSHGASLWLMRDDGSALTQVVDALSPEPHRDWWSDDISWEAYFDWWPRASPLSRPQPR
jgi:hypothetical protein